MSSISKSAPSSVVGLDIGTDTIKVAEAKLAKDGIRITGLGVLPTPPGVVDNSVIVDPQALGVAIKQILRDNGIKSKKVVSSISGQSSVVVRIIEVPRMTPNELAETMKWEVERHVPFSPTDIQMDFAPVEKPNIPPDAPNMEVLLAVAQRDAVDAHVKTLQKAGLDPIAIDVQPLAVSRPLIDMANGSLPYVVGVINIGATTTSVEVFEGGQLAFPGPPLPIAGINFTRAISDALGVPMEEAERLKKEFAEVDLSVLQTGPADTGFDMGGQDDYGYTPAPDADSYDSFVPQAQDVQQDDFSPFELGTQDAPQTQPVDQTFDISGEDVFDLGGGAEQASDFKPVFDLDEPEVPTPAPDAGGFDFDISDEQPAAQPVDMEAQSDQVFVPEASDSYSYPPVPAPVPADDIRTQVINAIAPVLIELATEIRRSLDYYSTRYQMRPEQIFLCGGTAKMYNLDQFLTNELGIPVQVANPMANLMVQCPKYTPDHLQEISPLFPVSIGLAIREMLE